MGQMVDSILDKQFSAWVSESEAMDIFIQRRLFVKENYYSMSVRECEKNSETFKT